MVQVLEFITKSVTCGCMAQTLLLSCLLFTAVILAAAYQYKFKKTETVDGENTKKLM